MLKITDKNGKQLFQLQDEDESPQPVKVEDVVEDEEEVEDAD